MREAMARRLARFSTLQGLRPRRWLLRIVRNLAHSSFHRRDPLVRLMTMEAKRDGDENPLANLPSEYDDPETALIKPCDRIRVRQMIVALPVELREALVLREIEGLSYKEIAEVTHVPIGTVMSRLWRARQNLAQAMACRKESA